MEIDLEQYRKLFYVEAREILEKANAQVLQAEGDSENPELLNSIFRGVHTIKGNAGSFELWKISEFAHHLEGLLAQLRDKKLTLNGDIVDTILDSLDYLESLFQMSESKKDFTIDSVKVEAIQRFLQQAEAVKAVEEKESKKVSVQIGEIVPEKVIEELQVSLVNGSFAYYVDIRYGNQEYQFGYDPYALLKNIKKNSLYYKAVTDPKKVPSFDEFDCDTLYLHAKVYCISNLKKEELIDLAFDSDLLDVKDITTEILEFKKVEEVDISGLDPEVINEFLVSLDDIHASLEQALLDYERDFSEKSLNKLFRYVHTIKGDADYIGLKEIVKLAHTLESYLDRLRKDLEKPSKSTIDFIFNSIDEIFDKINHLNLKTRRKTEVSWAVPVRKGKADMQGNTFATKPDLTREVYIEQVKQITDMLPKVLDSFGIDPFAKKNILRLVRTVRASSVSVGLPTAVLLAEDTIEKLSEAQSKDDIGNILIDLQGFMEGLFGRPKKLGEILVENKLISQKDLDEALKKQKPIGEILVEEGKVSRTEVDKALRKQEVAQIGKQVQTKTTEAVESNTMRVDESKISNFYNLIGELIIARNTYDFCLSQLQNVSGSDAVFKTFKENLHVVSRLTNEMQRGVMSLRMVPIKTVFQKYSRVVRDIARKQNKEIELFITGDNVEIDKKVADTLSDPLVHLIRNSCDHGIESPDIRTNSGKKPSGTITLKAAYEGNHAVIRILDDGKGLDKQRIIQKAQKMGYNTENLTDDEIFNLIFLPGLSTAEKVTDVSGRGVGMDVVQSTAKSLGGYVRIKSELGVGTETIISIPMSMGVSKALIVESNQAEYAIPLENVTQTFKLKADDIHFAQNRMFFYFRGEVIGLESLEQKLSGESKDYFKQNELFQSLKAKASEIPIVVLRTSENFRFGIIVDKHGKNMEIAIKPMPKQLQHIDMIAGVTIMGNGSIVQILNVEKL